MMKSVYRRMIASVLLLILVASAGCTTVYASTASRAFGEDDPFEQPSFIEFENLDEEKKCGFTRDKLSFTVVNDNTKIRSDASENSDVLYVLNEGAEVIVTAATVNSYDHTWFILEDGGYVYCRNVSFDLKKNTLTEYYAFQNLKETIEDPDKLFYIQSALLLALFTEEGGQYFYDKVCSYADDIDYTILTDRTCINANSETMKYIIFGYLAGRLGFTEREAMLLASNGEAVQKIYDNAMDSLDSMMQDQILDVITPLIGEWGNIAIKAISSYSSLKGAKEDTDFVNSCKDTLCVSDEYKGLISAGFDLGVADRD